MIITQIENNLQNLIKHLNEETFIYDLLLAYDLPKATVTRLQKGTANLSKVDGEVSLKKKLFFKEVYNEDLHISITNISKNLKHDQRFVIVTDYKTLLAKDTKMNVNLDIHIKDLPKNYDFFLPWAGMEKAQLQNENPADIKAAVKMAKLFDEINSDNEDDSPEFKKSLNVFLSRLLFCFFAEDSDIFEDNQFSNAIASHTQQDGSDLKEYLDKLFEVLNTPENQRVGLPEYLNAFPYVNGGLFAEKHSAPNFSYTSRKSIIESGSLSWTEINPDIFGSMFQAVNHADNRGALGQHFTSVTNIMKVIEPLFLNDLKDEFENARGNNKKLNQLLYRLKNIKIFDPACGSGNFLIIAYKELRRLEMEIFKEMGSLALSEISLNQFYGIELDNFAHEIAILALWLTKHQMNVEFFKEFGRTNPTLPLTDAGNIVQGNACRLDWEMVCPKKEDDEIYILGNPPYLGSKNLNEKQREDNEINFQNDGKTLDYISIWFKRASEYIISLSNLSSYAFVSTNSICQGEQVALLWPKILKNNLYINFAHKSFKWQNNAKNKANVVVIIVGVGFLKKNKFIYSNSLKNQVDEINPYLNPGKTIYIHPRNKPISKVQEMIGGNVAYDFGHLIFEEDEMNRFINLEPNSSIFFRKLIGGRELLNDGIRHCLWFKNYELNEIDRFPKIKEIVYKVKVSRLSAKDKGTNKLALRPHQFRDLNNPDSFIAIPKTSSERREYIPLKYLTSDFIPADSIRLVPNADLDLFSTLCSKMHMIWMRTISGKLKTDFRYSKTLSYNTFPFPSFSKQRKEELTQCALKIIDERLKHSEKTLAQLYDPDKMPEGLKEAHHQNDLAVERCYRSTAFSSDEERLEYLFKLYEKMIQEEKDSGTLFAKQKKTRKKKIIMPDIVSVEYKQTGNSINTNPYGMREMQERAFDYRNDQYILLKSPPASGKSRALMFLGLDKLVNQGMKKVIVAVPERSIGSSFAPTDLKKFGFFANWAPKETYNLCTPGSDGSKSKVSAFHNFMDNDEQILICTHATLRFACEGLDEKKFDNTLIAIDEFHHVSVSADNRLGETMKSIMDNSKAHIIAMTGSYFRGDSVPILLPEDEKKFSKVTYNYYEQLNGYEYLRTLGIGYHFYQGRYTNAIMEVLDTDKKTILHIPSVNSGESTKDKYDEVNFILDAIGDVIKQDSDTGVIHVKRKTDGKVLKVADLVTDTKEREIIQNYLRTVDSEDDIDIIIALGMAKEGFDWPYCEHALTVGYRGSLTEIIQIIGRATRDSNNKTHAQFTNLIAQPNAADDEVKYSVNNMLKAITASLLMEQVLAPNWKFKTKVSDDDKAKPGEIKIRGLKEPSSQRVKDIVEDDITDLKAAIFQDTTMLKAMPDASVDPEVINKVLIPKVIRTKYPDLTDEQVDEVRQHVVVDSVIKNGTIKEVADKRFIRMAGSFIDIDDIHIDLIDRVNPFQEAFEVLSKSVSAKVLKIIQDTIEATRIQMDFEEAAILWPKIQEFIKVHNRQPDINSIIESEKRMAECIIYLKEERRKKAANNEG